MDLALGAAYAPPLAGLGLLFVAWVGANTLHDVVDLTSPLEIDRSRALGSVLLALILCAFLFNCALLGRRSPPAYELRGAHRFFVPASGVFSVLFVFPGALLFLNS